MTAASPILWEVLIALCAGAAVLLVLSPRRAPLFKRKEIGYGWTPDAWQGWALTLVLAFAFAGIMVLFRGRWGG